MRKVLALLGSFASIMGVGWLVYRKKPGGMSSVLDSIPGFSGEVSSTPVEQNAHSGARPIMVAAFKRVMGRDPTLAEIQYVQAVANLETSYGKGWKDERCPGGSSSNNWGAVQARGGEAQFPCTDSHPDGSRYQQGFKVYATPEDGAADVVKHVFVNRPKTAAALASSSPTIFRASYAMRREVYYGGFCPKAVKQYGSAIAIPSYKNPDQDEGTKACAREAIELHATTAQRGINAIAKAMGEPAMPLGTYDDADAWYRNQFLGA